MADALDALISQLAAPSDAGAAPSGDALDQLIANLKQPQAAPQPQQVGVIQDVGKGVGAGLVKGTMGLVALPGTVEQLGRMGINKLGGNVSPEPALPTYQDIKGSVERRTGTTLYEPKTKAGQYASTVAEFLPGMLFPAGGAATTFAGRVGQRALSNVIAPGVVSETAGQLTKGTSAEPYARVAGGIVGGMVPSIAGRMIAPMRVDPDKARSVAVLANEGVGGVTAGQATGSEKLRYAESVSAHTPFAGGAAARAQTQQADDFTRAALRRIGVDGNRADGPTMEAFHLRNGAAFDNAASSIQVPLARPNPAGRMAFDPIVRVARDIANRYERGAIPSEMTPRIRNIANDLQDMASRSSNMDGRTYSRWRSELGAAARNTNDVHTRDALYDLQRALDTSAEAFLRRSPHPAMRARADELRVARREYRNMLVIEKAVTSAGANAADGLISPQALRNAAIQMQGRRSYSQGQGAFGELSRAGVSVMTPLPNSGTAPRVGVQLMGGAIGAGIGGLFGGPVPGVLGAAAGQIAGPALLGRATMSPMMQRYLQGQSLGGAQGVAGNYLRDLPRGTRRAVLPGVVVQGND